MAKSLSWKKVKYFSLTGQRQRLTLLIATWPLKVLCLGGFLFYIKAAESQSVIKINSQMCVTDDDVIASQDKTKLIISRSRIKPVFSAVALLKTAAGILQINKFETV